MHLAIKLLCFVFVFFNFSRTLYDCDEQEEFLESLSARIKSREKEIERMCNVNYQWFIESVSELHKVKSEANKIKVSQLLSPYQDMFTCTCMSF